MTKTLQIDTPVEYGVIDVLRYLLDSHKVHGVFTLKKMDDQGTIAYALITSPKELEHAVPLHPIMPVNAGKALSRFTIKGPTDKPVIAVMKPCELRAFIELVKREQGHLENLIFMSPLCGGVYPSNIMVDNALEKHLPEYWKAIQKGETPDTLRPACRSCTEFTPYTADITIDVVGNNKLDTHTHLYLNTETAETLLKEYNATTVTKEPDTKILETIRTKRETVKTQLFKNLDGTMKGIDGLVEILGRCIGCHGCSKVCPICYCKLCEFESPNSEYSPSNYEAELKRRGGLKIPPGTTYYHIGRLTHISISCVGCGSCEDACPVDIPISLIFKKVGESVQNTFQYVPGKKRDELIPLVTFEGGELSEIEE